MSEDRREVGMKGGGGGGRGRGEREGGSVEDSVKNK